MANSFLFDLVACRTHFNRLPYVVVKPILDAASPEQLHLILDSNPVRIARDFPVFEDVFLVLKDYFDEVEPLWQNFCLLQFKDVQREEFETYYELYWVISMEIS